METIKSTVPENVKMTFLLRTFGLVKAPLILFCGPKVEKMTNEECIVSIPLNARTKNHLKSLYFGALCIGADVAGGLIAVKKMRDKKFNGVFAFKDVTAKFLKRAEGETKFVCKDGPIIDDLIQELVQNGGRSDRTLRIEAFVPKKLGSEPVATFDLTISIKALDS